VEDGHLALFPRSQNKSVVTFVLLLVVVKIEKDDVQDLVVCRRLTPIDQVECRSPKYRLFNMMGIVFYFLQVM